MYLFFLIFFLLLLISAIFFTIFALNFAGCFLGHVCCIKSLPSWQVVYSIGLPSADEEAPNTKF